MLQYKLEKLYTAICEIEALEQFFFVVQTDEHEQLASIDVYDWETDDLLDGCGILPISEALEYVKGFL
ncbi:hypothetical protein [Yersinia phage MHG19]|nr:hypothetical protein [Yersinia phage MHG19]